LTSNQENMIDEIDETLRGFAAKTRLDQEGSAHG